MNAETCQPSIENEDRRIDLTISKILRFGVLLSSILVASGGAILLTRNGNAPFVEGSFDKELCSIPGILNRVRQGHCDGLIQLGVVVLLATPFMRVAFAALAFLKERDYIYVCIALTVLAGLTYSLFYRGL